MNTENTYVLNHDFGYANINGQDSEINKLKLRNANDLDDYISGLMSDNIMGTQMDDLTIVAIDECVEKINIKVLS